MSGARNTKMVISNLDFSYDNLLIFSHFSLAWNTNKLVLKGQSGCGKTTLLRILYGMLTPRSVRHLPDFQKPVMVLQEDSLFPWMTGRANIQSFIHIDNGKLKCHKLYNLVESFIDKKAYQMSYGQRRCIELFRIILYQPHTFFLDEPFNYLDDHKVSAFIDYFGSNELANVKFIITSHRHDSSLDKNSTVFLFQGDPPYTELVAERFS